MTGFYADLTFNVLRVLLLWWDHNLGHLHVAPISSINLSSHFVLKYAYVYVYVYIYFYIEYLMVSILFEV